MNDRTPRQNYEGIVQLGARNSHLAVRGRLRDEREFVGLGVNLAHFDPPPFAQGMTFYDLAF